MRKPKVVSLFSGAGGLDIGFKKAGFHTVFATDVWDIACNTLKANNMADEVICNDVSLYLVYLMIVSWWDLRMQKVMRRKLVKQ